jgi:hypothetical protein
VATEPLRMSVVVTAEPEEVWEYFTRAEAMVTWMGHYALLDARPGGELAIDVNESQIRGNTRSSTLRAGSSSAGASRVPASYHPERAQLRCGSARSMKGRAFDVIHSGLPSVERDKHDQGWRDFLGRLAEVITAAAPRSAV